MQLGAQSFRTVSDRNQYRFLRYAFKSSRDWTKRSKKDCQCQKIHQSGFRNVKANADYIKKSTVFYHLQWKDALQNPIRTPLYQDRLIDVDSVEIADIGGQSVQYKQMNLFSDFNMSCTG